MVKKLLIVYHSQSGATAQLAAAVKRGAARETDIEIVCQRAWDCSVQPLVDCDGFLLGLAENSGFAAGSAKDFLDRIYYPAQALAPHKPYGLFISAGNDGRGAVSQLDRIFIGVPMKAVVEPIICRGEPDARALQRCEDLGHTLAAGLVFGIY